MYKRHTNNRNSRTNQGHNKKKMPAVQHVRHEAPNPHDHVWSVIANQLIVVKHNDGVYLTNRGYSEGVLLQAVSKELSGDLERLVAMDGTVDVSSLRSFFGDVDGRYMANRGNYLTTSGNHVSIRERVPLLLDPSAAKPFGKYLDERSRLAIQAEADAKGIPVVILHYESYGDQCVYLYMTAKAAEKVAERFPGGLSLERTREMPSDIRLFRGYSMDFDRFIGRVSAAGVKPVLVSLDDEDLYRTRYQIDHVGFWTPGNRDGS
jgi:hypothetical protein